MEVIKYTYGDFAGLQIREIKTKMRKQIFFLLCIVDPKTAKNYDVDVDAAIENVLRTYGSLNDLLGYPEELVEIMISLNAAFQEYQKGPDFNWTLYRKLILDACASVSRIKEVS